MRKIPFAGIELTSQRVRGFRGTSDTKRNSARKTFKHAFSLQQDEITLYIFNASRTVFTVRNKQKLRTPSGNPPFKCPEEVLCLQPLMIPPTRFDFSPLTGGCSEGLGAFRFFFKHLIAKLRAAPINTTLGCRLKAEG